MYCKSLQNFGRYRYLGNIFQIIDDFIFKGFFLNFNLINVGSLERRKRVPSVQNFSFHLS